ncbi:hypothetical protein QBC38DRAFT_523918, partial [Podospora fimiseda]
YFPSVALTDQLNIDSSARFELTLFDLNDSSLSVAEERIKKDHANNLDKIAIETVHHDALDLPIPDYLKKQFTSVSMFNLLHCIAAPCQDKVKAFQLAADALVDGGVLAGCTVLPAAETGRNSWVAGGHSKWYNDINKVFANKEDKRDVLEDGLNKWFEEVETRIVGSMLIFKAKGPKRGQDVVKIEKKSAPGQMVQVEQVEIA